MLNKKINCNFKFYQQHRGERLKFYKEQFDTLSYFQLKVLIVGFERGDLNVA